jgi:hypothetical protein
MVDGQLLQSERLLSRASCGAQAMTKLEMFYHSKITMPHSCVIATILWYTISANHSFISIHVLISHLQAAADQVVKLRDWQTTM